MTNPYMAAAKATISPPNFISRGGLESKYPQQ